jgi:hypothetical protein
VSDLPAQNGFDRQALDALYDRFEQAWKSGARPAIEDYLAAVPAERQAEALAELLGVEWEYRWRGNEEFSAAEYQARFPGLESRIAAFFLEAQQRLQDTVEHPTATPVPRSATCP